MHHQVVIMRVAQKIQRSTDKMAYTTIDDPSEYFQTIIYTGNGSARSLNISGNADMQPDMFWSKKRANASQTH